MENVLKARITADVSDLKKALSDAEKSLSSYTSKIERVQQGISKSDATTKQFELQLQKLTQSFNSGNISQTEYDRTATRLKNNIAESRNETKIWQTELTRLQKAFDDTKKSIDQIPAEPFPKLPESLERTKGELTSANNATLTLVRSLGSGTISAEGFARSLLTISTQASRASTSMGGLGNVGKAVLGSLITPANLVVLGITAVTAAFSLYRKSVAEAEEAQRKANEAFEASVKKIDEASNSVSGEIAKINALKSVIEDETNSRDTRLAAVERLQRQYPTLFGNLDKEKLLNGQVETSYQELTKAIIARARASEGEKRIVELDSERQVLENTRVALEKQLETQKELISSQSKYVDAGRGVQVVNQSYAKASKEIEIINEKLKNVSVSLQENESQTESFAKSIIDYQSSFASSLETVKNKAEEARVPLKNLFEIEFPSEKEFENSIQNYIKSIQEKMGMMPPIEVKDLKIDLAFDTETLDIPDGIIQNLKKKIAEIQKLKEVATDTSRIAAYNQQIQDLENQLKDFNQVGVESANQAKSISEQVSGAFSGMAFQISSAFNISDQALRGFIGTLISSTPKIISSMMQKASASRQSAEMTTAANFKEATGDVIVTGVKAAKALGPVGLAALPVFISAALMLVSRAFGKGGGASISGASSGGGGASGSGGQTFSNLPGREFGGPVSAGRAYLVGEKRPEIFVPSQSGTIIPKVPEGINVDPRTKEVTVDNNENTVNNNGSQSNMFNMSGRVSSSILSELKNTFDNSTSNFNTANIGRREFGGPVSSGRAYLVGERRPEIFMPSQSRPMAPMTPNPSMPMRGNGNEKMQLDVNIKGVAFGEDILFTVEQASIKKGLR